MKLNTPIDSKIINNLKSGDIVYISGTIYTGRDAAHAKLVDLINNDDSFPKFLKNQIIYYVGPTPKKPDKPIGSAGPTSSYRMDLYSKVLMDYGVKIMIGKGNRSDEFKKEMIESNSIYLSAIGGTGAKISSSIISSKVVAFEELGPEAVYKLEVRDFPAIVAYDLHGNDLFKDEKKIYRKE